MNLLFFQNCISPHQMPYIKELSKMTGVERVILVAPVSDLDERKGMGWNTEVHNGEEIELLIDPTDDAVLNVICNCVSPSIETWCLYSGINAFPEVSKWFKMSLGYNVRRGIITEPPYIYDHPLWQHAIRFAVQDWRYVKYIDKVFLMGDEYVGYYRFWSKRWDVIPFKYCTEWRERSTMEYDSEKLKVLYVGALSSRKNVGILLSAISELSEKEQSEVELGIIGDGEQKLMLVDMTKKNNFVSSCVFYGSKPMDEISLLMEQYDVLVLPSLHDGWGAVVNEALTLGLYAICSDRCGAKFLLKNTETGLVFKSDDIKDLKAKIQYCLGNKKQLRESVASRIKWAKENISGVAVAQYFLENLTK